MPNSGDDSSPGGPPVNRNLRGPDVSLMQGQICVRAPVEAHHPGHALATWGWGRGRSRERLLVTRQCHLSVPRAPLHPAQA